jgi:multiple sugar transport system permease protein
MGYASAMAWILLIIVLGLTTLVFRSSALWVYYEGELKGRS